MPIAGNLIEYDAMSAVGKRHARSSLAVTISLLTLVATTFGVQVNSDTPNLEQRAIDELRELFRTQPRLIKAHAAESLLKFGCPEGIYESFIKEWDAHQNEVGYRIVVMRLLSRASATAAERELWTRRIRDVFVDPSQPDRLYAIECLAKLGYHVQPADRLVFENATVSEKSDIAVLAYWTLSSADVKPYEHALVKFLSGSDPTARYCSAYVLRQVPKISDKAKMALKVAAQAEKPGTLAFSYLNSASFVLSAPGDAEEIARCRSELTKLASTGNLDELREICAAFAERGTKDDVPLIAEVLSNRDPDIREAAAHALVRIERRNRGAD